MQPYERQMLLVAASVMANSPYLDSTAKGRVEKLFQEIIDVYVEELK